MRARALTAAPQLALVLAVGGLLAVVTSPLVVAPLVVLLVLLSLGVFPGEQVLDRARRALAARPLRAPARLAPPRRPLLRVADHTAVLARSLGRRGPPARGAVLLPG